MQFVTVFVKKVVDILLHQIKVHFSRNCTFPGQDGGKYPNISASRKNSDLENQLSDLEDRIRNLESIVHESEIRRKIDAATKYINQEIVEIIKTWMLNIPITLSNL